MKNFKIKFNEVDYMVILKSYNNKVVKVSIIEEGYSMKKEINSKKIFTGIAKCHPNDKFDLKLGEGIALAKALKKRNKYYDKLKSYVVVKLLTQQEVAEKYIKKRIEKNWMKEQGVKI